MEVDDDDPPCRLLKLPRELRNHIYEHLVQDSTIRITAHGSREDGLPKSRIHLDNAPIPAVLRTCKQIHDEYKDVYLKRSELRVTASELNLKLSAFELLPDVPKKLFKHVKWCHVVVPYGLFVKVDEEKLRQFMQATDAGESAEELLRREWTPSKHATNELSRIIGQLAEWVPEKQASIGLEIFVSNPIDHFEFWNDECLVQAPTFHDFMFDKNTPFTRKANLELRFSLTVAQSAQIKAWNMQDVTEEEFERPGIRVAENGLTYEIEDSEEVARWYLCPKCSSCYDTDYHGFATMYGGILGCNCHH